MIKLFRLIFRVVLTALTTTVQAAARALQKSREGWSREFWVRIIIAAFMIGFVIAAAVYYRLRNRSG